MQRSHRPLLVACSLLMSLAGACAGPRATGGSRPRPPNIVLIVADDLGYGHLGSYGQAKFETPRLDRMAREGMRFTQYYAGASVCAPSRSVLMTGQHAGHTAVRGNAGGTPLLPEDVTIAEVLRSSGYRTGHFGKWGLGDIGSTGVPWSQGFDEFFGYLHQVHAHFYYPYFLWEKDRKVELPGNTGGRVTYAHDAITERALDFVRRQARDPFFLYLAYTVPHAELLAPPDAMAPFVGKFPEERPYAGNGHYAAQATPRAAIAAMITRLDRDVGRVLDLLAERGMDRDTLVLFTSDNGPAVEYGGDIDFFRAAGPLRGGKKSLYEGGLRVPMIARWPGRIPAGAVSALPWAACDILPTAATLAGAALPAGVDGRSMLRALEGRRMDPPRALYWELGSGEGLAQAARIGKWKVIRTKAAAVVEVYDLESDAGETRDVAAEHPEIVEAALALFRTERTAPRERRPEPPLHRAPAVETGYVR